MKVGSLDIKSPTAIARLMAVATTLIEEGIIKVDADFNLVSDALNEGYQQRVFDSWAVLSSFGVHSGEEGKQAPMMVEGWTWGDLHAVTRDVVEGEGYRATTAGLNRITDAIYAMVTIDKDAGRIPDIETVTWYVRDYLRVNTLASDGVYSIKGE